MNRTIFLFIVFCLFSSCSKDSSKILKCDCSKGYLPPETIYCPGQICRSDSCRTYFGIWKDLFLGRNQMSQDYFDNHITVCSTNIHKWVDGTSFEVFYKVKIEWAEFRLLDDFIFYISSSVYPGLDVPRNVLLSKSQIETILNGNYFGSKMNKISPVNKLKYNSESDAMKALINASNIDTFCIGSVSYAQKSLDKYTVGHPYFTASGILNWNDNKCIEGSIDLVTGETYINEQVCYISFCLLKGTLITLPGNSNKPIEKIKKGDKILSLNLSSMKVEEDIVQKTDSVVHNDMVKIVFSDMTENINTSDHPYLVKGKGWCSFKPQETLDKYKINASRLQTGDTCFKYTGNNLKEVYVKSITENNGNTMTYNISSLKRNNSYFANGVLVSDEKPENGHNLNSANSVMH